MYIILDVLVGDWYLNGNLYLLFLTIIEELSLYSSVLTVKLTRLSFKYSLCLLSYLCIQCQINFVLLHKMKKKKKFTQTDPLGHLH